MFQLTGGVSCTHQPCIFDIAFIYFTQLYIHVFIPCRSNFSAVTFDFSIVAEREKPDGDCRRVCHAI